jgi:hypothetical protein
MEASQINEFRIFAHGVAFDPEAYLAATTLKFDGVWHKYELSPNHPKSSGVFKILGDGPTLPIYEQERIAIQYLTANREALRALALEPTVTTFILGLHYQVELEEGTIGFSVGSSAPLMSIALDIGIAPTYYVVLNRHERWNAEPDLE